MDRFETALVYAKANGRAQLASAMEARNLRHQGEGVKALKVAAAAQCYPDVPAIELEAFAVQWAVWHNTPIQ